MSCSDSCFNGFWWSERVSHRMPGASCRSTVPQQDSQNPVPLRHRLVEASDDHLPRTREWNGMDLTQHDVETKQNTQCFLQQKCIWLHHLTLQVVSVSNYALYGPSSGRGPVYLEPIFGRLMRNSLYIFQRCGPQNLTSSEARMDVSDELNTTVA